MNKAIIPALAVSLLMFVLMGLGGNTQDAPPPAAAPASMGVIRLQDVYAASKVGQEAIAHLEEAQNAAIARLTDMQAQLEKARTDADDALAQRLQVELQGFAYSMQDMMNKEQERVAQVVNDTVNQGIAQYREANGLAMILGSDYAQSFDPALDVTDKVLAVVDALPYTIGDLPSFDADAETLAPPSTESPAPENSADPAENPEENPAESSAGAEAQSAGD